MTKFVFSTFILFGLVGAIEGSGHCSDCRAVDCSFDTQCGVQCTCVKLNGKIKGQCVER